MQNRLGPAMAQGGVSATPKVTWATLIGEHPPPGNDPHHGRPGLVCGNHQARPPGTPGGMTSTTGGSLAALPDPPGSRPTGIWRGR